jgi:hypothetical protein
MSENTNTTPDPLAVALAKLDPAPHGFNRDRLMFEAGRESKARAIWWWQLIATLAAIASVIFAYLYLCGK